MKLSSLLGQSSFALLGPGFSACEGFTLLRDLGAPGQGANLVLASYEAAGREAHVFGAGSISRPEVEFDLPPGQLEPRLDESGHGEAVEAIRCAIAAGDVYQVNLTLRARLAGVDGATLFATLCRREVPRFAAWVRLQSGRELVSASPELFFAIEGRRVLAEPMKGTARADAAGVLETSAKDRAELAMITDLLRNDLVPVCEPRSVRVVSERRFVRLPYAMQAVSDVEGTLREGLGALDVLDALHPGGSITGAPKPAAMRMIASLEKEPRGVYCGALGLCERDRATFSILIRTAEREGNGWIYGVGGGIVWGSTAEAELAEARLKLGALR